MAVPRLPDRATVLLRGCLMKGKRNLIVEDVFVTGELLRSWIERAGGLAVGPALTG